MIRRALTRPTVNESPQANWPKPRGKCDITEVHKLVFSSEKPAIAFYSSPSTLIGAPAWERGINDVSLAASLVHVAWPPATSVFAAQQEQLWDGEFRAHSADSFYGFYARHDGSATVLTVGAGGVQFCVIYQPNDPNVATSTEKWTDAMNFLHKEKVAGHWDTVKTVWTPRIIPILPGQSL
jgi:hypothetical protein